MIARLLALLLPLTVAAETPPLFTSPEHDTILCAQGAPGYCRSYEVRQAGSNPGRCYAEPTPQGLSLTCTPQQFAVNSGYSMVVKVSSTIANGYIMLVLTVAR